MACVKQRRVLSNQCGSRASIAAKIAVALIVCVVVRVLAAQAPQIGKMAPEEVDARNYKYMVPLKSLTEGKSATAAVRKVKDEMRVLLTSVPSAITDPVNKMRADAFYLQYLFPFMTTEEGLKTIADERVRFLRDHLMAAKDANAHNYLTTVTLAAMTKIVQDPQYHPGARYNAMLIISNLNDQEPSWVGATQTLPEPMRAALPFVIERFKMEGDLDSIKLAALFGLSRYLEWENYKQQGTTLMRPADRAEIIKEITALAQQKEPPQGRSQEGHTWFRRRAIEALGMACLTKPDPAIAATFEKLLNDDAEALNVRLTVAATLGRVNLQAPVAIDPIANAKQLGYLALLACDTEVKRAENNRKTEWEHEARLAGNYQGDEYSTGSGMSGGPGMPGGGGMMPGSGMRPGGMGSLDGGGLRPVRPAPGMGLAPGGDEYGSATTPDPASMDPKHYRVEFFRRRIRQQLYAVQLGLTGGEDHPPPKLTPTTTTTTTTSATTSGSQPAEKKGMFAIAKTAADKRQVDDVYWAVRKLIETIEYPGPAEKADYYELIKDLDKSMKSLEQVAGKRVPAAGTATSVATSDDAPSNAVPGGKGPLGKGIPGKGVPGKAAPANPPKRPPAPGKVSQKPPVKSPSRPQPSVFGQPRR